MNPLLLLQLLPTLITSAGDLVALIDRITSELKQNAELTPEQSAQLDQHIATLQASDWWKADLA